MNDPTIEPRWSQLDLLAERLSRPSDLLQRVGDVADALGHKLLVVRLWDQRRDEAGMLEACTAGVDLCLAVALDWDDQPPQFRSKLAEELRTLADAIDSRAAVRRTGLADVLARGGR